MFHNVQNSHLGQNLARCIMLVWISNHKTLWCIIYQHLSHRMRVTTSIQITRVIILTGLALHGASKETHTIGIPCNSTQSKWQFAIVSMCHNSKCQNTWSCHIHGVWGMRLLHLYVQLWVRCMVRALESKRDSHFLQGASFYRSPIALHAKKIKMYGNLDTMCMTSARNTSCTITIVTSLT